MRTDGDMVESIRDESIRDEYEIHEIYMAQAFLRTIVPTLSQKAVVKQMVPVGSRQWH